MKENELKSSHDGQDANTLQALDARLRERALLGRAVAGDHLVLANCFEQSFDPFRSRQ